MKENSLQIIQEYALFKRKNVVLNSEKTVLLAELDLKAQENTQKETYYQQEFANLLEKVEALQVRNLINSFLILFISKKKTIKTMKFYQKFVKVLKM